MYKSETQHPTRETIAQLVALIEYSVIRLPPIIRRGRAEGGASAGRRWAGPAQTDDAFWFYPPIRISAFERNFLFTMHI